MIFRGEHPRLQHLTPDCLRFYLLPYTLLLSTCVPAQTPTPQQLIEDATAQGDDFTLDGTFAVLEYYARRPLHLNRVTAEELAATYLLTPLQIDRLLDYRDRMGGFKSVYELQAVPGLDLPTLHRLRPYVTVGKGLDDVRVPLRRMLREGHRELFVRGQRRLERARGYERPDPNYRGSPWRSYVKYRQRYGKQLSLGVVAEKDPGEGNGFDFYSAHLFLRRLNKVVRAVALGDFAVSFGQGLILYTGFGYGKSSLTTSVARRAPTLQPYASVDEARFMRGAGVTLALGKPWELTLFASHRPRSGNLAKDSLSVTSLKTSGLHRTEAELEDRNVLRRTSYGGRITYRPSSRLQVSVNTLGEQLSLPLEPRPQPYNHHYFRGNKLLNVSLDYHYRWRNVSCFGEVAGGSEMGKAMLHGINLGLHRRADVAIVYRHYDRDYRALNARPFAETSGGRNEEGLYLGVEVRPALRWRVNAYFDTWRHPYQRYGIPEPSTGREYRLRVSYAIKRKLDSYLELRRETKAYGKTINKVRRVVPRTRFQGRLHLGYKLTPALEWRSRIDGGYVVDALRGRQLGGMVYQDLHYRPLGPFSFSARVAVFHTDGFDVRFYQYENGLTYNARVLPYYHEGGRSFLLLRYKGLRKLTLEARVAQTRYFDGRTFGSGWEATERTYRTEVGGQLVWRW